MSASVSRLTEVPTEVLEQVLQHLPGQDVVKMEVISRRFQDLVHSSPILQYKRNLFSASLVENPRDPCDFAQRRKAYEKYERKWSDAGEVVKAIHELPEKPHFKLHPTVLGRNLVALTSSQDVNSISFLHLPPVTSAKPIEWWSILPLPFEIKFCSVYPPDNILAVTEETDRSVSIHLLNLSDGYPYNAPYSNIITWEAPRRTEDISIRWLAITSSRVAVHLYYWEVFWEGGVDQLVDKILVWDWKNGDLILNLPPADRNPSIGQATQAIFLDEFRMMVLTPDSTPVPEFALFDTLVPYGDPGNLRRFRIPPRYHGWSPVIHVDDDRCLGTPDRDTPFITDITQAVLVIRLISPGGLRNLLIVRIQAFFEHTDSMNAGGYIPWDRWGRGVAIMEVPEGTIIDGGPYPLVQGPHLNFVWMHATPGVDGIRPHLCTFDFSRRGWSVLPLQDTVDGVERRVLLGDGRQMLLQGDDTMIESLFDSLGGARFTYAAISRSDSVLHVWELI